MLSISESRPSASRMEIKKISSFIIEFSLFKSYFEVCSFVLWHCSPRGGWKRKNLSIADVSNELVRSRCFNSGDAWVSTFDFLLLNLFYFILHFKTQCQINISLTVWRQSELNLFFFCYTKTDSLIIWKGLAKIVQVFLVQFLLTLFHLNYLYLF